MEITKNHGKILIFNPRTVPTIVLQHASNTTSLSGTIGWPPTPFQIAIPGYPHILFYITKVAPGGTHREMRWLYATLEALGEQIGSSTAAPPSIFAGGQNDIASVEVKEFMEVPQWEHSRAAMSAGMKILHDSLIFYQPAQLKAIFGVGSDTFAELVATFSPFEPFIPDLWHKWPASARIPTLDPDRLQFNAKKQTHVGDGWDLKHGTEMLKGGLSVLERHQRMGESKPVDLSLKTAALDIAFKYETEIWSSSKTDSTLTMEMEALKFYLSLVEAHGVDDSGFKFVDGVTSRNLGIGGFTFRDLFADPGGAEGVVNSTAVGIIQDDAADSIGTS